MALRSPVAAALAQQVDNILMFFGCRELQRGVRTANIAACLATIAPTVHRDRPALVATHISLFVRCYDRPPAFLHVRTR